jgi:hypothetical protein
MNKSLLIPILLFTNSAFAINTNIDFYPNKSVISFEGKINEFNNIKFENKTLYLDKVNRDLFLRLNDNTGIYYYYTDNDSIYNKLRKNIGENILHQKHNMSKILKIEEPFVVIESSNKEVIYEKNLNNFKFPLSWFNINNGYEILFNKEIKENDNIFYSFEENTLSYKNNYEIKILDDQTLNLTHFVEIVNNGNPYKDLTLSFFQGDMNINNSNSPMKMAKMEMSSMADNSLGRANFSEESVSNIKLVSIEVDNLRSGLNKILYKNKDFKYEEYVKINNIYQYSIETDSKDIERVISFNNYISINNKEDIFPSGELKVYSNNKLIISDNINFNEKEELSILKNTNKDLKAEILEFEIKDNIKRIKSINIFNNSNKNYTLNYENKKILLEANKKVLINLI